jgi:ABC-type sulfate transport system permease subunit
MTRTQINHWTAATPLVLSAAAFLLAFTAGVTGWERNLPDEGVAAHLFQLLIAVQVPIVILFLLTADWAQSRSAGKWLALDLAAIALAFAPVALFHL